LQGDSSRAYFGADVGLSLVHDDRMQFRLGLGVLGGIPTEEERDAHPNDWSVRLQVEKTIGYRLLLTERAPLYLVPQVGGLLRTDFSSRSNTTYAVTNPPCLVSGAGPCAVERQVIRTRTTSVSAAPVVGVSLLGYIGGLSYEWQPDVTDIRKSTHQVFFGVEF
jgi:hypothetical protein